jgi:hypothetical protein
VITHGTPGDWLVWAFMLAMSLLAARLCYRQGKFAGAADGEVIDVAYGVVGFFFLAFAFLVFIHAPFNVG